VILLSALILGLLAGWGWARWHGQPYRVPDLKFLWLVPAALAPQLLAIYLPGGKSSLGTQVAPAALPVSLILFLAFVWLNRQFPGMLVLMVGLVLNLLVIATNGGWMPISPETASHLPTEGSLQSLSPGTRFGQKDILVSSEDTRLELLSDRFLLPAWLHYPAAFSLGDSLVAIGAFWLLASRPPVVDSQRSKA
jgi:hypothetical protein